MSRVVATFGKSTESAAEDAIVASLGVGPGTRKTMLVSDAAQALDQSPTAVLQRLRPPRQELAEKVVAR